MTTNADLANWGEPPASVEEEAQAQILDALLEGIRRGEQDDGLAARIGLAQRFLPTLAGTDIVEVEKYVFDRPAVGAEPLLESNSSSVVLARVADEET